MNFKISGLGDNLKCPVARIQKEQEPRRAEQQMFGSFVPTGAMMPPALAEKSYLQSQRHYEELDKILLRDSIDERKLQRKEELHLKRDLVTYGIYENFEGFLCKEIIDANGKVVGSKKICSHKSLQLFKLLSPKSTEKYFCLHWEGCEPGHELYFTEESFNAKKLGIALAHAGISLCCAREYKKTLIEQLIAHLVKHSQMVELPVTTGWNKMSSGWQWINPGELTIKEVALKCKKK